MRTVLAPQAILKIKIMATLVYTVLSLLLVSWLLFSFELPKVSKSVRKVKVEPVIIFYPYDPVMLPKLDDIENSR